jgi:hypothetical protein
MDKSESTRQVIIRTFFISSIRVNEGESIYLVGDRFLTDIGLGQIASAMQGFFISHTFGVEN